MERRTQALGTTRSGSYAATEGGLKYSIEKLHGLVSFCREGAGGRRYDGGPGRSEQAVAQQPTSLSSLLPCSPVPLTNPRESTNEQE